MPLTQKPGLTILASLALGGLLPAMFIPGALPALWLLAGVALTLTAAWRIPEALPEPAFALRAMRIVGTCFGAYFLSFLITTVAHGGGLRELDKAIRYVLGILLLFGLARARIDPAIIRGLLVMAAAAAFGYALYDRLINDAGRVGAFMNQIQFGVLAAQVACLNVVLAVSLYRTSPRKASAHLCAGAAALVATFLSGSLTAFTSLFGLPVAMLLTRWHLPTKRAILLTALLGLVAVSVLVYKQSPVVSRITIAVEEVVRYSHYKSGIDKVSSNGARLENFANAWGLFMRAPLLGVGSQGYLAIRREQVKRGELTPYSGTMGVAHNEYLDALAKRGLAGLAGLLALLLGTAWVFRKIRHQKVPGESQAWAVAGITVCAGVALASITQNVLTHSSGTNFLILCIAVFLRLALQRPAETA